MPQSELGRHRSQMQPTCCRAPFSPRSANKPTPQAWRVAAPVRWNYSRLLHVSRVQTVVVTPTNIARYKHHLRDWKRDGADARRARQPAGMVPARLRQAQPKRTWVYRQRKWVEIGRTGLGSNRPPDLVHPLRPVPTTSMPRAGVAPGQGC